MNKKRRFRNNIRNKYIIIIVELRMCVNRVCKSTIEGYFNHLYENTPIQTY